MSKWRPAPLNCIYVIPDIHGLYHELMLILKRILPLRKSDGGFDRLIFLGDYIDRGPDSPKVLDTIISLKRKYRDKVVCLKGNHEDMFVKAIDPYCPVTDYSAWLNGGGAETLSAYLKRSNIEANPFTTNRTTVSSYVPKEHVEFIKSMPLYHELDDFIFVHAGCDPLRPMTEQSEDVMLWDRSLYNAVKNVYSNIPLPWDKVIVTGHNTERSGKPLVRDKYMMIDGSYCNDLMVFEMISLEAMLAQHRTNKMIRVNF